MATLTDGQLRALRNLAQKHAGNATAFVNIADAQQLTRLGFASRSRQGWDITPAGSAHLSAFGPAASDSASVSELHPDEPDDGGD